MIDDIIVVDDVISKTYQDLLEETILLNKNFPWYYMPSLTTDESTENDIFGFTHVFKNSVTNSTSGYFDIMLPFLHMSCEKINFKINNIYYGRTFLTMPTTMSVPSLWHTDLEKFDHLVFLYYVNDSDGSTLFSKLTDNEVTKEEVSKMKDIEIVKKVDPKKGRGVFFNGNIFHASSTPTRHPRCITNFDLG